MSNAEPTLIARWETKGKDWLNLYRGTQPGDYFYRGNGCGGGLGVHVTDDWAAVMAMEAKGGAAHVLKLDRPSLRRVTSPQIKYRAFAKASVGKLLPGGVKTWQSLWYRSSQKAIAVREGYLDGVPAENIDEIGHEDSDCI